MQRVLSKDARFSRPPGQVIPDRIRLLQGLLQGGGLCWCGVEFDLRTQFHAHSVAHMFSFEYRKGDGAFLSPLKGRPAPTSMKMKSRVLGSTHLQVTPIGLGLAALGRPGYINLGHAEDLGHEYAVAAMEAHAHDVLDAAFAGGVRYFDAARSYGRAETFLGRWLTLHEHEPDRITVGSKWGYTYTADWQLDAEVHEVKEHSLDVLQRQWTESRANLGAHLDLYQIHSATLRSGVLGNLPVLQELARLKEEGTAIGLTVSGPQQRQVIARAIELEVDGARLFDTVQVTWNLLERSTTAVLEAAGAAGVGVIVKEALANGRLTARNTTPEFEPKLIIMETQASRLSTTVDALALSAVLAQPWTTLVLSGAAQVDHIRSNLKALDVAWDQEAAAALYALREPAEVYWERRSNLEWR